MTLCLDDDFLILTPEVQGTKAKINKWDYIKLKSFCIAKEIINEMKRQRMEWEKVFTNYISEKGINPKYTRNTYKSIAKGRQYPIKK